MRREQTDVGGGGVFRLGDERQESDGAWFTCNPVRTPGEESGEWAVATEFVPHAFGGGVAPPKGTTAGPLDGTLAPECGDCGGGLFGVFGYGRERLADGRFVLRWLTTAWEQAVYAGW